MTQEKLKNYPSTHDVMNDIESLICHCRYLQLRWKDEYQYEDRKQYIKSITECCDKLGIQLIKASETFCQIQIKFLCGGVPYKSKISLMASGANYTLECIEKNNPVE